MAPESVSSIVRALQPIYDIPPPVTPTAAQGAGSAFLDIAPLGSADIIAIGLIAALIVGVLMYIVRMRQR